ncbi:hypothetical protein [Pelagicoccus sp. SDUM812005]|uniref:hypothetical protein n=1 Tax=Pelagicoccus sp. SDUM812005 TaxID=3041257 RepID=UPI00280F10BB|nr:hypothetical protein [Pelagicoccus sp. SDUM812005]MDQ8183518.1 hypothetical protein [Pelagicoccus sp. SDUM812005]
MKALVPATLIALSCILPSHATAATPSISQGLGTTTVESLFDCEGARRARPSTVGEVSSSDGKTWITPATNNFLNGPKASDLYNDCSGIRLPNIDALDIESVPIVEIDSAGEVFTGYLFADNYFELYVNGTLVAVDPVPFTPFNSCVVRFKAKHPITYAVKLIDWEESPGIGTESGRGNPYHPGDGGFAASFSDGTVTNADWKAQTFYIAPVPDPSLVIQRPDGTRDSSSAPRSPDNAPECYALHYEIPDNWASPDFNDSSWPQASVFTNETVGVRNKPSYMNFTDQFIDAGATFIWSSNLVLDNEVLVRFTQRRSRAAAGK